MLCDNKDFCNVLIGSEDTEILEFNQYLKSEKMPYIIYADCESLIKKQVGVYRGEDFKKGFVNL